MDAGYFLVLGAGALALFLFFYFAFLGKRGKQSEKWFFEKGISGKGNSKGKPGNAKFSGNCDFCGKMETLPFRCKFCGQFHCQTHRLPESHNCPGLSGFRRGI